jgi:hypothetical protein
MTQSIEMIGPSVEVQATVEISPRSGGWYPWYEVHADSVDPMKLIVCATKWNANENAFYGVLYSSPDAGRTWRTALEDRNSAWVSEHSCAFGANGKVYFVSAAAKVVDGRPSPGRTRIFVSDDRGGTWTEAALTGPLDYSSSVVDTRPGPNENRLYTVFNDLVLKPGDSTGEQGGFSLIGLLAFKDGDEVVTKAPVTEAMTSRHYQGSYPERVMILKDGSLLALYWAGFDAEDGTRSVMLGAVHTNPGRSGFSAPVEVARNSVVEQRNRNCHASVSSFASAYDPTQDKVYVAYAVAADGRCKLILKTSADDGNTWSEEKEVVWPPQTDSHFYSPAMVFNRGGILGLMWRDEPVSDCWYFSASADKGRSFTSPQPLSLSGCSSREGRPLTASDASLRMAGTIWIPPDRSKPGPVSGRFALGLNIVDSRNHVWRSANSLAATFDGIFHPVWIEAGRGEGQLRTATVIVNGGGTETVTRKSPKESDLHDVSEDVVILYGGDQHYDTSSDTLEVDVIVKNKSARVIRSPLILKALTLESTLGKLVTANASNDAAGPGAIWDLSNTLQGGVLQPGSSTSPYPLVFRIPHGVAPKDEAQVVSMQVKVIAPSEHGPEAH